MQGYMIFMMVAVTMDGGRRATARTPASRIRLYKAIQGYKGHKRIHQILRVAVDGGRRIRLYKAIQGHERIHQPYKAV